MTDKQKSGWGVLGVIAAAFLASGGAPIAFDAMGIGGTTDRVAIKEAVTEAVAPLQRDIVSLQVDVSGVRGKVSELSEDVAVLKDRQERYRREDRE